MSVLRGRGDGTFGPQSQSPAGSRVKYAIVQDVDEDGLLDIVTANEGANTVSLQGNGNGTFDTPSSSAACQKPHEVQASDLNNDGHLDLVVACWFSNQVRSCWARARHVHLRRGPGGGTRPLSVAIGDFDADGRKDVVSANHGEKNLSLFLGAGGGAFSPQVKVPAGALTHEVRAAHLRWRRPPRSGDGERLRGFRRGSPGIRDGSFSPPRSFPTGPVPISVTVSDFDGDGDRDVAVANSGGTPTVSETPSVGVLGNGTAPPAAASVPGRRQPVLDRGGGSDVRWSGRSRHREPERRERRDRAAQPPGGGRHPLRRRPHPRPRHPPRRGTRPRSPRTPDRIPAPRGTQRRGRRRRLGLRT